MQPPSACPCRGGIPWQRILLAVSLLTFWYPHPTALLTIEPVPFDAAEGRDVLLLVHNVSENAIGYNWFKGNTANNSFKIISYLVSSQMTTPGPAFNGGEKIYSNGSLLLQKVTQNDTGFYTLQTVTADAIVELATGEFFVHVSLLTFWNPHPTAQLTIVPVPSDVAEGKDVLLLVHNVSENTVGYAWYRGQITDRSHLIVSYLKITHSGFQGPEFSGRETIHPNGSLLFMNVTKGDTGFYTLQTIDAYFWTEAATGEFLSLLTFWNPHPTAPLSIELVPFDVAEGKDVLLLVHNVSENTVGYFWYRGQITNQNILIVSYSNLTHSATRGPAFSSRETIYPNGSLLFVNVTNGDTGFYTLQTTTANFQIETATGEFRVHGLVAQPSLRATNTEPHSVAMTCLSGDPGISITWIFNSQTLQLTDRMQLSPDHRTLSIDPVRQEDAGEYQCEVSNPASSSRSDRYRLAVICEWPPSHPVLPSNISLQRAIIWHQP
uniref:Ig-like domain-containing protein n=1 Tax=Marmota marmota marmota TaxID=9994 RepID=A0A8C5ZZC5_MARMA